ncbi:hypothetical protein CF326_g9585, partial [Tilletia indica]
LLLHVKIDVHPRHDLTPHAEAAALSSDIVCRPSGGGPQASGIRLRAERRPGRLLRGHQA